MKGNCTFHNNTSMKVKLTIKNDDYKSNGYGYSSILAGISDYNTEDHSTDGARQDDRGVNVRS